MENRAHALAAGLFTLVLGAALVVVALWFSKDDVEYVPYVVTTTTSVSGLKTEAPVRYRGVEVGKVQSIRIEPGVKGNIHIQLGIVEGTPVTRSTFAKLGYLGVTGLAFVALDDSGDSRELLRSNSRKPAEIPMRRSIMDTGEDLVAAFGEIATRVNRLLDEDNQKSVRRALAGLEQATLKTVALAEKLEAGAAGVPGLVGDARGAIGKADQLMASLASLAARIEERVEALNRVAKSVEDVGATARAVNDETLPRLNALVEDLHKETRALDRLLNALGEHPQSLVFGAPPGRPGPGEKGFSAVGGK